MMKADSAAWDAPAPSRPEAAARVAQSLRNGMVMVWGPDRAVWLSLWGEGHGHAVHAVAQAGRAGAVVEDVPQVAAAVGAMDRGADHAEAAVPGFADGGRQRLPEAGPAGTAVEFCA
ncbi:hypothetical protein G6F65_022888 [Rhizopus arrhizus]|nr:hypothetical protein G6F65_022888 [Rhizopus arrhizus]